MSNRPARIVSPSPQMDVNAPAAMPIVPRSPLRALLDDYLDWGASKRTVSVFVSFDLSGFVAHQARCKAARRRPPGLVAYVSRCLGVALEHDRSIMAVKHRGGLFVPEDVNIALTVASKARDGAMLPLLMEVQKAQAKTLPEIAEELAQTARGLRRQALETSPVFAAAIKAGKTPPWLRRVLMGVVTTLPRARANKAFHSSHIGVTSLTQYMQGRGGWGLPLLPFSFSLTLGGISSRAVVVGDEVVVRPCLDVTVCIDHQIIDGAPALEIMHRIGDELESGRLLAEYETGHNED